MGQESEPNGIKKPAAEKKVNLVFYLFFLTFLFVNREVVDLLREAQEQLRFGRKRTYPGKETYITVIIEQSLEPKDIISLPWFRHGEAFRVWHVFWRQRYHTTDISHGFRVL